MAAYALELNDADIVAWDLGRELLRDTGHAYVGSTPWRFGAAAAASARLHPHHTLTAQFAQIDAPSIGALPLSAAEVVYRQLLSWSDVLRDQPGAWLVSPAASSPQLGLLLGIAHSAGLNIGALADRAVAAASALPAQGTAYCIDVELERCLITEVRLQAGLAQRLGVAVLPQLGLRPLLDAWSKGFARRMVQATRFDPLHVAATEQALFNALPGWLEQLTRTTMIEEALIESDSGRYAIEYRAAHAAADVADQWRMLSAKLHSLRHARQPAAILLSAAAAKLPGLMESLQDFADCEVFTANRGQAAQAALGALDAGTFAGPASALMLSMPHHPYAAWPAARAPAEPAEDAVAATHVVYAGRALGLAGPPILVGTDSCGVRDLKIPATVPGVSRAHCTLTLEGSQVFVQDHSRFGSFLNDEQVTDRALVRIGDRLRLGNPGVELTFVRME